MTSRKGPDKALSTTDYRANFTPLVMLSCPVYGSVR